VAEGYWWRAERHVIRNGCVCPEFHVGHVQYDPWQEYRASRAGADSMNPPYTCLLTLVGALAEDPQTVTRHNDVHFGPTGKRRLLDWCAGHGLLGLLPHQTVVASLAPRWERMGASPTCVPVQHVHPWDTYGWSVVFDSWVHSVPEPPRGLRPGDLVTPAQYVGRWREPMALVHMLGDG
jgi:hypothetical protein